MNTITAVTYAAPSVAPATRVVAKIFLVKLLTTTAVLIATTFAADYALNKWMPSDQ